MNLVLKPCPSVFQQKSPRVYKYLSKSPSLTIGKLHSIYPNQEQYLYLLLLITSNSLLPHYPPKLKSKICLYILTNMCPNILCRNVSSGRHITYRNISAREEMGVPPTELSRLRKHTGFMT